jgi:PEP-CTERM motif
LGETFNLVDYGSLDPLNASFTSVDVTGLAAGFLYSITPVGTDGTDFQLTALNNGIATTTPEPSTWALLFAGMSLLAFVSRKSKSSTPI